MEMGDRSVADTSGSRGGQRGKPLPDFSLAPKRLADALRSEIIFLELEPDSRIVEEDIAERFGISRSPVREALRLLEVDGLLVREERRGARVSSISRRDLDQVYLCRIPLEGLAASEAAKQWTVSSMARLMDGIKELERAFATKEIRTYFEANVAFSDDVYAATDNVTLRRLLMGIGKQSLRYRYLAYSKFPDLISSSVEGNRELLDFISRRDSAGAQRLTERLIEQSWMTIRDHIPE